MPRGGNQPKSVKTFSIGSVLLALQPQPHDDDDTWRLQDLEWCVGGCFAIHSVKPRTVPVVFVAEGSSVELCNPGWSRSVLMGIYLPNVLAMVRHESCLVVNKIYRQTRTVCGLALSC